MPYGLQFADEPVEINTAQTYDSDTKPNETYRKDTEDYDA